MKGFGFALAAWIPALSSMYRRGPLLRLHLSYSAQIQKCWHVHSWANVYPSICLGGGENSQRGSFGQALVNHAHVFFSVVLEWLDLSFLLVFFKGDFGRSLPRVVNTCMRAHWPTYIPAASLALHTVAM